jgi:cytochrome c6
MRVLIAVLLVLTFPMALFAADGPALYKAKCASCHDADGSGQGTMGKKMNLRDLGSPEVQAQSDKELYDWTAVGKNKMPGYKTKLSEEDINALVAHMRSMKK